jgi:hypothetical protein
VTRNNNNNNNNNNNLIIYTIKTNKKQDSPESEGKMGSKKAAWTIPT